jgi:hypothetical protein
MLLTDGSPNSTEDLRVYETAILDVANGEGIDLCVKLNLALDEVSEEVVDVLLGRSSDLTALTRRMRGVSDVVVTPQLKRWHATHTLEVFYRDAFNNQLNDRYQQKFLEYQELARQARNHTLRFGIGLVTNPLPIASIPQVTLTAATAAQATYFVQMSWVSSLGQQGAPSKLTTLDTVAGTVPVIGGVNPPAGATGFNVFMGMSPDTITLQNAAPIPVGSTFTFHPPGLSSGVAPGTGQIPDYYITGGSGLIRG